MFVILTTAMEIQLKRSGSPLQESPVALKRWKAQPAVTGAEAYVDLTLPSMREVKTSVKVEKQVMALDPTSVLDLQTSPCRSGCSSASLSSNEETVFPLQNHHHGGGNNKNKNNNSFCEESSLPNVESNHDDIASCMAAMEGDHINLEPRLSDFANIEVDFGFELDLQDGSSDEMESFPTFQNHMSDGFLCELFSDPGLCLIDKPKLFFHPEGFQDAQRLQELDDSLSSMLSSTNGVRLGAVSSQTEVMISPQCRDSDDMWKQGITMIGDTTLDVVGEKQIGFVQTDSTESWQVQQQQHQPPEEDPGLHLVHLLLACAEAIDESDFGIAKPMLSRLRAISNPHGDPMQRIALYFANALSDRLDMELHGGGPLGFESSSSSPPSSPPSFDSKLAYQAFYEVLPFAKFSHFTANQTIFEAVGCNSKVHVVDLDIREGLQWPSLIQSLAMRPEGPPHLRITGVGACATNLELTKRRLSEFAESLNVPFEFSCVVIERVECLEQNLLRIEPDEALVINCSQILHSLSSNQAALEKLVYLLRNLNPVVVTLLEVEANHNGETLISRFVEALHYYCALFDSLEGSLGRDSPDRYRVESMSFASEIKSIVAKDESCGSRHMKSDAWQSLFTKFGFRNLPSSSYAVQQAQLLLKLFTSGEMSYKLSEESGALTLGWQDTPIVSVSSWSC